MPSDVPHQLVTFADWMGVRLILRDLITRFTVGPCLLRGCWTSAGQGADCDHERVSKLQDEWHPQGGAETLMTCINGAWPLLWLLSSSEVTPSRRHGIWAGWSGYDLHTHTGSVSVFTQPLKDDKIQCRLGVGSLQAVHERIFFLSPSLSLLSLPQCLCILACTNVIATTERGAFVSRYVTDWFTISAAVD